MVDQLPSSTGESRICKPSAVSYIIYVWCACHYPLTRSTNLVGWLVQLGRLHGEPRQHQSYLSLSKLNGLLGRSRQWFLRGWTSSNGWKSAWDDPRGIHGKLHNELGIIYIMWSISRKSDFVASSRVFFSKVHCRVQSTPTWWDSVPTRPKAKQTPWRSFDHVKWWGDNDHTVWVFTNASGDFPNETKAMCRSGYTGLGCVQCDPRSASSIHSGARHRF